MKTKTPLHRIAPLFALALLATFAATHDAKAQYQVTTLGSAVVENFGGMTINTGANATNNSLNIIQFSSGLDSTTQLQRNSAWTMNTGNGNFGRSGARGNFTTGTANSSVGFYAAGNNSTTTDRSLAFQGGGNATTMSSVGQFQNATGSTVTSILFGFTGEQWQIATSRASFITVTYSTTSAAAALGGTSLALNFNSLFTTPNGTLNGDNTANRTVLAAVNISSLSLADGSSIWFAFKYDRGGTTGSAQMLAIDDISVTFNGTAPPAGSDLYWTASGSTLGGTGSWTTAGSNWAPDAASVVGAAWDGSKKAIFAGTAGTVTVQAGGIAATNGLVFSNTGYVITGGDLTLGGSAILSNSITTDASVTATINSKISGANGMTKAGAGDLVLGGANDYTGGTTVSGGRLTGTTTSLQGTITNNAAVTFDQGTDGTYSSAMSGTGSLRKSGVGAVTLSGANTYSGGTEVAAGRLIGTTTSLQGTITNNAAVTFDQTTNGTYASAMSGTGSLRKSGAGDVTLSGANTYNGGTEIAAGRLIGTTTSLQGSITNNAAATFDQTTNGTYAGVMTGSGSLVTAGSGDVTLSGNSSFAGGTSINGGGVIAANNNALGSGNVALGAQSELLAANGVSIANTITVAIGADIFYQQDFNSLGIDGLPTGWTVRTGANASSLGTTASFATNQVAWSDTGGAFKNFASATGLTSTSDAAAQNASTDRALGVRQTGSFGDPGAAFTYQFSTTGETLSAISLDLMILNVQTRSTTWTIQYGLGAAPTSFVDLGTWADPGTFGTTPLTLTGFGTALDNQADVFLRVVALSGSTGSGNRDSVGVDNVVISGGTSASGLSGTLGSSVVGGTATFSGAVTLEGIARLTAASGGSVTFSGALGGAGGISKTGTGTVTLSGASANTFTGLTTVTAGTLQLDKAVDTAAIAGDIEVNDGAFLLLSSSGNVSDAAEISLSGGTITRGSGVSEVFGNLNVSGGGFLDFGTGTAGTLSFGTYTPSALLTINNFGLGNTLTFGSDLSGSINNAALFSFDNGFNSSWNSGTSTFTITAIPEPSTYLAAAGLLSLMLWPSRKRLLKDTKKILGLTPPMRDRLAARRAQKTRLEA